MDLRVRVIRTSGKNYTLLSGPFKILDDFLAFSSDIRLIFVIFLVTRSDSLHGLCLRDTKVGKRDRKLFSKCLIVIERQERI